ncbi:efflux RND transporter permease subunit [Bacteroides sp. 214]|uniref:efflux RND transporter permease subunit n=1 Tax=Bacteroides sp. 214 TaxID=2302935 RepID=UPI0013D1E9D9|nr:efflux RND transporter permease subunit [Bacteroides sp. 214]NDW12903.1 efflux RND transporter permease subunit [Bacteroides sp. 214]
MSLYEGAVKKPIMTSLCFVAIVIFGLFSLSRLPIDLLPDFDTNTIMVITSYPGASASDIENNVSRPLENTLNTVSNLKHISSRSSENMSLIILEFEYGYDIDVLTNDVRDKLDMVTSVLPDDAETPIIFKFSTDMIPIILLSVQAEESQAALYKILDDNVANPLARIPGVGSVSISGAPKREIQVYCDPNKLEAYHLTIETISSIIGAENRNIPGGNFDIGNETYALRVEGEFKDAHQMENIVVSESKGATVYLRDVARIIDTVEERAQEAYTNGVRGGMIIVQKQSGANSVDIARRVTEAIPELQKSLPTDVKLGIIMDTSENIILTINSLAETVMYALLFVIIVVFLFLGRWRATLVISIVIPISLIASFIYLAITGNTLNIISLSSLSIAIGMVVDDAIVVLENVTTHIERGSDPKQAAVHGTNEVAISVIASTLTMLAVFFPLTMVTGMTGVLFKQLGWMMCIIMIVSTVAALSLTPMMCSQLLRLQKKQSKIFTILYGPIQKALDALDKWYARMLDWSVRHRAIVISACAGFFLLSLLIAGGISTEFFPTQDNGSITATLEVPIGTRKEVAQKLASKLTDEWREKYPEIQVINYRVGQASSDNTFASMQDNGSHIVAFNIRLTNPGERKRSMTEIGDLMRLDLLAYPEFSKTKVVIGGSSGMGGQATADFEIYGYDMAVTDHVAAELKRELFSIKGVSEVNISRGDYQPEYQVDFDREKLALHSLNLSTAGTYLRNRINGATASQYREDGDEYDIIVRYAPEFRTSLESLEDILIYNAKGNAVRVKDVGKVVERFAPPTIERKDRERIVTVSAVISGAALGDVVNEGKKLIEKMDVPANISVQIAGSYEDQQESFADLATLAVLIIVLVFIVMAAQFESLTYPFIIMFSVPFAVSGVLMALFISGSTLSVMSLLGGIMLIGIVVKNGIVLVDYIILCRERGQAVINSVVTAGKSRLRPVLMTTMTTILGMIPMAVGGGQGSEMWRPMGVSVIGGLTISTVLTLILVPVLYCVFAGTGIKRQRKQLKKKRELDTYFEENKHKMIKNKK